MRKRILSIVLTICMVLVPMPQMVFANEKDDVNGDVNGDGEINILDATLLQKYLKGIAQFTEEQTAVADIDEDGEITDSDVRILQINNNSTRTPAKGVPATVPGDGLKVKVTSNFFPEASVSFDDSQEYVTVTYFIASEKDILNFQWTLTYDSEYLKFDESANKNGTKINLMPLVDNLNRYPSIMQDNIQLGYINGSGTNLELYPFANKGPSPFVTATFKVIKNGETTVDLYVDYLCFSMIDSDNKSSDPNMEELLIHNGTIEDTITTPTNTDTKIYGGHYDIIAPEISGIINGAAYCPGKTVTVSDNEAIASVTVNGTEVALDENGQFELSDEGDQVISVTDMAGNEVRMKVTVGHSYGAWQPNVDGTHTHSCTVSGCNYSKTVACSGGEATCTSKAICEYCSEEYGGFDSSNHNLENISGKAPTYTEAGHKQYWYCKDCKKYFSDAAGTNVIENIEAWKAGEGRIDKLTLPSKTDSVASDKEGNVTVTIEKSIVTVGGKTEVTVSDSIADTILAKLASSSTKKVIINATTGSNTAAAGPGTSTYINLSESAVKKLAEIEDIEITIATDNGKIVLDKETLAAVAASAGNDGQVTLIIETAEQNSNLLKVELKLQTSNGNVTDFNKGNVKVTVAISEALKGKKPVCVYIDEDGEYHKIGGTLNADGTFTFVTGHFSTYVIMAEEEADTEIAAQKEEILAVLADQKLAARSRLVTMKNGKKAVKIIWHNENGEMMDFDGVEIYRSTKRYSGYGKTPFFTTEKDAYYNTAIQEGAKYYYKVRGYVEVDGEKIYTDYSTKAWRTVK